VYGQAIWVRQSPVGGGGLYMAPAKCPKTSSEISIAPAGFAGRAARSVGLSVFRYAGSFHALMTCWCDIEFSFMVLLNCGLTFTPASLSAVLNSVLKNLFPENSLISAFSSGSSHITSALTERGPFRRPVGLTQTTSYCSTLSTRCSAVARCWFAYSFEAPEWLQSCASFR